MTLPRESSNRDAAKLAEALAFIKRVLGDGPHTGLGEACGVDACAGCLMYATAQEALAEYTARMAQERDENRAELARIEEFLGEPLREIDRDTWMRARGALPRQPGEPRAEERIRKQRGESA